MKARLDFCNELQASGVCTAYDAKNHAVGYCAGKTYNLQKAEAINKYLESFSTSEPSNYILSFDAK